MHLVMLQLREERPRARKDLSIGDEKRRTLSAESFQLRTNYTRWWLPEVMEKL